MEKELEVKDFLKKQETRGSGKFSTSQSVIKTKTRTDIVVNISNSDEEQFKKLGYIPNEEDNPNVEVRETEKYGRAIFAIGKIRKGETIAEFKGEKYWAKNETDLPPIMVDHTIQVGEEEHVHGHRGLAELANHACGSGANCGIKDHTKIVAIRDISPGEEICWDYRRSEDSDWYLDGECQCGSVDCTKIVGPFRTLSLAMKEKYLADGFTSDWIVKRYRHFKD